MCKIGTGNWAPSQKGPKHTERQGRPSPHSPSEKHTRTRREITPNQTAPVAPVCMACLHTQITHVDRNLCAALTLSILYLVYAYIFDVVLICVLCTHMLVPCPLHKHILYQLSRPRVSVRTLLTVSRNQPNVLSKM